jgi:hypothetical protein
MIRFRYQPTFKDWFTFNRIVGFRHFRFLIGLSLLLLILFLLYPFALMVTGHDEVGIMGGYRQSVGLLVIPVVVCFLLIATYLAVRKRWRAAEEVREARDYEIDENGVRVTGITLSGFLEWRHFTRAELKKGYFLLKTAQNQFHYFPAAVVPDQQALGDLLARKVAKNAGKG